MARPKLGESETKRLQMVITEDEIAAIDGWCAANGRLSRAEGIRRLCKLGFTALALLGDNEALRSEIEELRAAKDKQEANPS